MPQFAWVSETLEKRLLLSADALSALVGGNPATELAVTGGNPFSFDVQYESTGAANTTAGEDNVTVRLHFDSSALTFDSLTDGLTGADLSNDPDLAAVLIESDTADADGDPTTDSFVAVTFTSTGELPSPATLFTANFTAAAVQTGETVVNFSGEVDAGDTLTTTSLTIDAVGPTPVLTGPTDPVGMGPFVVTLEFGEEVTGIDPFTDVQLGNATLLDFRGSNGSFELTLRAVAGGNVTVDVPANVVTDADGNGNLAATQLVVVAQEQDFGDAPDSYNTTRDGGPRHFDVGPTLGDLRDTEPDASSPLDGTGDDRTGVQRDTITESILDAAIVTFHTNFGTMTVQLDPDSAPLTVENFLQYVTDGDYNNSIFHRLVGGFVLQGGGFTTNSEGFISTAQFTNVPTDPPVQNEFNRLNLRGTIAMAKLGGDPDSATSQFFFNIGNNSNLDTQNGGFTVFGELTDLTLLDELAAFGTQDFGSPFDDLPLDDDGRLIVIRFVGVGSASGTVFDDANGNGVQDAGELGTADVTVFADLDNDGQFGTGDLFAVTDTNGNYTLDGLPLGDVVIRQLPPLSTVQSQPLPGEGYTLNVSVGSVFDGVHFGNVAAVDASFSPPSGDEDGVRISDDFRVTTGTTDSAVVTINNSSGDARLYAWIDFNGDGDFEDAGEQIADGTGQFANLGNGEVIVTFDVPTDFTGTTFARFRVSTEAGLGIGGEAGDGEVEDYALLVEDPDVTPPAPVITGPSSPFNETTFNVTIDFGEAVAGFEASDILVGNGTIVGITGGADGSFIVAISADSDGEVTVDVPDTIATDAAGNANLAADQFTLLVDANPPEPVLTGPGDINVDTFTVEIDFGETVTGFSAVDIVIQNGTLNALTGGADGLFFANITALMDGVVTINVPAGAAQDAGGNDSLGATPLSVLVDTTPPTPTISGAQDSLQSTFTITVDFGEDVTGFELSDLIIENGRGQSLSPISDAFYFVTVEAIADGNVTIRINAGAAEDAVGNLSLEAEPFTVDVDTSPAIKRIAIGSGRGANPEVRVFDAESGFLLFNFLAYDARFRGGVQVATGDVTGDGTEDIITAAGRSGGPHVKVFDGFTGQEIRSFMAYDTAFTGGVFVAAGDVNNDGLADIITGAGTGGGPHVKVFSGLDGEVLQSFFAYDIRFHGGVRVASGDLNRDGFDDVITGAGEGGGPHVKVFDAQSIVPFQSFMAFNSSPGGGIYVAAGDINDDGLPDIITGAGRGGGPHVRIFNGSDQTLLRDFFTFVPGFDGGVRVAAKDIDDDGAADILTAAGPGGSPHLMAFDGLDNEPIRSTFPFDEAFAGGIFVN